MANTKKRKGGGTRRSETVSEMNERARTVLRQQLRAQQAIKSLCRQVNRTVRQADRALLELEQFLCERQKAKGRSVLPDAPDRVAARAGEDVDAIGPTA